MAHKAKTACKRKRSFSVSGAQGEKDKFAGREKISPEIEALRAHPQLANQYRVLRSIGRGAQGTVYEARDIRTGEIVAIKALSFREMSDWKASELFMREIALLKSMQIEGTPRYIDAIDATASPQPYYFLVQEFIPGESFQVKLDRGETFSTQAVIAIALAIIPILEKLRGYSPPIVHRDIKPSNIMMTPYGDIYLIDFGAAMFSERRTGGSTFAGTAGYMAPEQCMGTSTPDSDVYGLGATLIHLLTGIAPYKMQMQERSAIVSKRHAGAFPCSITLHFKPYLPKRTPHWFVKLLEVMVSPYPNQRVKNLARLVRVIRNIGGAELEGHSMYSEEAAHLASMKCMGYQPIIPFGVILLTTLPVIVFLSVYLFVHLEKLTLYSDIFHSGDIFRLFSIVGAIMLFFLKKYFFGKALEKSYEMNSEVEQFHEVGEAQHRKVMEHYGVRESTFCEEQTAWELFKNL